LKESLANALHDPTMDLALEQERADGAAEIVDDSVALNYDGAGIGIDLDLDDVAAVGEGLSWRHAVMRRIEPRLYPCRPFRGVARRLRHRENIEAEVGAGHAEYLSFPKIISARSDDAIRTRLARLREPQIVGRLLLAGRPYPPRGACACD